MARLVGGFSCKTAIFLDLWLGASSLARGAVYVQPGAFYV